MKLDLQLINEIENKVEFVKRNFVADVNANISVFDIVKSLNKNLTTIDIPMSKEIDGMIFKGSTSQAIIVLNSRLNILDRSFTFLHELYHYYFSLIENKICRVISNDAKDDIEEMKANLFAQYFLIPRKSLKAFIKNQCGFQINLDNIILIENYFNISRNILIKRLFDDNMIEKNDLDKYMKIDLEDIKNKGYDTRLYEPLYKDSKMHVNGNYIYLANELLNLKKISIDKYNELINTIGRKDLIKTEKYSAKILS